MQQISNKTFHLAITMAGAISAGAYTAGVMDYLLEALDNWTKMKQKAAKFFDDYPFLKQHSFEEFKQTAEFNDLPQDQSFLKDFEHKVKRYKAVPDHEVKIEIMSGASAGGMTAAIASLVLQLENKHHVKFLPDVTNDETLRKLEEIKVSNRLYNSWVNLTQDEMLSVLLGDEDIKIVGKPVSALNSQFIRQVAERALKIDETDTIISAPYVSDDFNLFVTLTNLEGYQKSLVIDNGGRRAELSKYGEFITYNHSDLVMFSFGENSSPGTVHIDFNRQKDEINKKNIDLLGFAAVATGAFPIGLEYAYFERDPAFINQNFLIRQIHPDMLDLVVATEPYKTTFIDGGLINNEPFELTDCLLKDRLKRKLKESKNPQIIAELDSTKSKIKSKILLDFPNGISDEQLLSQTKEEFDRWLDEQVRKQRNHTILMIDPFPSERKKKKSVNNETDERYPYDLLGVISQLVATARSQLLVKTNLFTAARDVNDFSCYLVAPRRRRFQKDNNGEVLRKQKDNRPLPDFETGEHGETLLTSDLKPITKVYDGSAAIACGVLGGFGGFLDKSFREHDFYLGRLNCQSFLRKHFRIKSDGEDSVENSVTTSYSPEGKEIFQKECGEGYVPIVPEMDLLKENTLLSTEISPPTPDELYWKLDFPKYDIKAFKAAKKLVLSRIGSVFYSIMENKKVPFLPRQYFRFGLFASRNRLFKRLTDYIQKQLEIWELIRK